MRGAKDMSNNNLGCLGFVLRIFGIKPNENYEVIYPYSIRDDFLSPAERSFYMVLKQVLRDKYAIFVKVALKDIFFVKEKDFRERTLFNNKINLKHIDFLICSSDRIKPVMAIELDDASHNREDRQKRDYFINKAFEAAGLKLLRVENRKTYILGDIKEKIEVLLEANVVAPIQPVPEKNISVDIPVCPKCGIAMVLRTLQKGDNQGKSFYGCANFPKCRSIKEI
ncbi:MAG: DUF2726 domain-containing protein [Ruminiclostridium sp.]|nr:DUF2726 domain-containing protein [Ruminiclostridium sp.]